MSSDCFRSSTLSLALDLPSFSHLEAVSVTYPATLLFITKEQMWFARSLFLVLATVWTASSNNNGDLIRGAAAATEMEQEQELSFLEGGGHPFDSRRLTYCNPALTCCPTLKFLSQDQAMCDPEGGYETLFKVNNTWPVKVCRTNFPTVILLGGLGPCKGTIKRVKFTVSGPGISFSNDELVFPYTAFQDDPDLNLFTGKVLPPGDYTVDVKIVANIQSNCVYFAGTYKFCVLDTYCPLTCGVGNSPVLP